MGSQENEIVLYTNRRCPWAHRAHIALDELKVPFKEVTIDLDTPRTQEYLAINPRGLVPSISFNGEIYTESAVVSWLLADAFPSGKLVLPSSAAGGPQQRARIAFFVDTYFSKFQGGLMKLFGAKTDEEQEPIITEAVDKLVKEIEPLLKNAKPFFGGSSHITQAEVLTGSFVIRLVSLTKVGIYPAKLSSSIAERAPNFWKWAEAVAAHPSVTGIYDEEKIIASTKARIAKARAS
ncbi:thioredoxin-like protein [Microthyrium microscopicum]|uniref:Thioredoxin-like protein n=1 Tax=Microthyrium microscopicum TaxID=703497 RepID=A0A6A6TX63_9PEZI|nr:thioredoxin-like protein [Microthyrium microscopicum]